MAPFIIISTILTSFNRETIALHFEEDSHQTNVAPRPHFELIFSSPCTCIISAQVLLSVLPHLLPPLLLLQQQEETEGHVHPQAGARAGLAAGGPRTQVQDSSGVNISHTQILQYYLGIIFVIFLVDDNDT